MKIDLPDEGEEEQEVRDELPAKYDALVERVLDDLRGATTHAEQKRRLRSYLDHVGRPQGLPEVRASFDHPEFTEREARAFRKNWMEAHEPSIEANLRRGCQVRKVDEGPKTTAIAIPIKRNIVTDRYAHNLLREVTAPNDGDAMIAQFGATGQSNYKFMTVTAMGVGTDPTAEAVGDTAIGQGAEANDEDQFCWYIIDEAVTADADDGTFGSSLETDMYDGEDDPPLSTNQGVQYSARPTGASPTFESGTRAPASAQAQLRYNDNSPSSGDFEYVLDFTWPFGSDGQLGDGNFGSDADPDEWREVGLANALHTGDGSNIHPGGAHPDSVHHLATRRTFAGTGFAKTSNVELSIEYTVRFSSG